MLEERRCDWCAKKYQPKRTTSKNCCDNHRMYQHRLKGLIRELLAEADRLRIPYQDIYDLTFNREGEPVGFDFITPELNRLYWRCHNFIDKHKGSGVWHIYVSTQLNMFKDIESGKKYLLGTDILQHKFYRLKEFNDKAKELSKK